MKKEELLQSPARLELSDVTVTYDGHTALEDISFVIDHGDQVAVVVRMAPASPPSSKCWWAWCRCVPGTYSSTACRWDTTRIAWLTCPNAKKSIGNSR